MTLDGDADADTNACDDAWLLRVKVDPISWLRGGMYPTHRSTTACDLNPAFLPAPGYRSYCLRLRAVLAGLLVVLLPIMLGLFQPPTQLFVFVLLLNYAMPTAINMSVRQADMTQLMMARLSSRRRRLDG